MEKEGSLTRLEKAAIIISSLPEEIASNVMRHLDTGEIEKVSACMSQDENRAGGCGGYGDQ